jgi:hypothetical protein
MAEGVSTPSRASEEGGEVERWPHAERRRVDVLGGRCHDQEATGE